MERLLLASGSPRRRVILESLGIPYDAIVPEVDEAARNGLPPAERVVALALDKAWAAARLTLSSSARLVLGSDTLVCVSTRGDAEEVLGKPGDIEDARRMIGLLAGRRHLVHTGLALIERGSGCEWTARSDSAVFFSSMSADEIEDYLDSGEWSGAAGAYRVQERAAFHIERIEGSWSGIVGLPIRELYGILQKAGFRLGPRA